MEQFIFTVFTPTYNRSHLLPVLFQSLCQQTCHEFEWVIVDDGSADDTTAVVREFERTANFPITYVVQEHSGKHKAINLGVQLARGKFFGIADSDDYYASEALERCLQRYAEIPENRKERFVGMTGLCATPTGQLIGSKFPAEVFDSDALGLVARRVHGDKAGFLLTEIMRRFPFPEDLGFFVPEGLIWNRIACQYSTRYFNQIVMFRDYQANGLTVRSRQLRMNAPRAARQYYLEFVCSGRRMPIDVAVRYCSNYVRFSLHAGEWLHAQFSSVPSKKLYIASAPLGWALYLFDKYELKRGGGSLSCGVEELPEVRIVLP